MGFLVLSWPSLVVVSSQVCSVAYYSERYSAGLVRPFRWANSHERLLKTDTFPRGKCLFICDVSSNPSGACCPGQLTVMITVERRAVNTILDPHLAIIVSTQCHANIRPLLSHPAPVCPLYLWWNYAQRKHYPKLEGWHSFQVLWFVLIESIVRQETLFLSWREVVFWSVRKCVNSRTQVSAY